VSSIFKLLADDSWVPTANQLPPVVTPSGLSRERQCYLYNQICEFCRAGTENLICPLPSTPLEECDEDNHGGSHQPSTSRYVDSVVTQDTHGDL